MNCQSTNIKEKITKKINNKNIDNLIYETIKNENKPFTKIIPKAAKVNSSKEKKIVHTHATSIILK